MAPVLVFGYTGAAVVLLSALAFLIPVLGRGEAVSLGVAAGFALSNAGAWALGALLRKRGETSDTGVSLLALGDALLPLTVALAATSGGGVGATLAVLLAASYLAPPAWRLVRSPIADSVHPCFVAGSGVVTVQLARHTHDLGGGACAWLLLALAIVLAEAFARGARAQQRAFRLAGLVVAVLGAAVGGAAFLVLPARETLVALAAGTAVLAWWALRSRDLGADCRLFGLGAYAAATLLLNACLREAGVSSSSVLAANTLWIALLTLAGMMLGSEALEPFRESAHWLAFLLALALCTASAPALWPFSSDRAGLLTVSRLAAAACAALIGAALATIAAWRRRHPPIAFTVVGLAAGLALLNASAYLAPLLALLGAVGLWTQAIGTFEGAAFLALLIGALYLAAAEPSRRVYPALALRVSGYAAIVCAGALAASERPLAVVVWLLGGAVFLWRSVVERKMAPHVAFIACLAAAAVGVSRDAGGETLGLAAASVVALGVYRILSLREPPSDRANLTLLAATVGAAAAIVLALFRRPDLAAVVLVLWATFPLMLAGARGRHGRSVYDEAVFMRDWVETFGWTLAHAAGAAWLMLLWRGWGFPWGDAGLLLALWAWIHSAARLRVQAAAPGRPPAVAMGAAATAFMVASLVLPVFSSTRAVFVASLLINATLLFSLGQRAAEAAWAERWRWLGTALTAVAIMVAIATGAALTVAALAAAALAFLWRSFVERSLWTHLGFLGLAISAAVVRSAMSSAADTLPVLVLALGLLAVCRGVLAREGRNVRARITLVSALAAGWGAVLLDAARGLLLPFSLALVWAAFLAGTAVWDRRPEELDGRPDPPEDRWLALSGSWLAHLSGALAIVAAVLAGGLGRGGAALALAGWAAAHVAAVRDRRGSGGPLPARERRAGRSEPAARASARHAVHAFSALAVVLAFAQPAAAVGALACLVVGGLYVALRAASPQRWLEHAAAAGLVAAAWLFGRNAGVTMPEFYLAPVGAYLYLMVHLDRMWARRTGPAAASWSVLGVAITRPGILCAIVLLLNVAYPFWALLRTPREDHLYYLGVAAVVLFYGFALRSEGARAARVGCTLFVAGAVYLLARAEPSAPLSAFLAGAGVLVLMGRSAPYILRMREYRT
jgi:hypothetical protein